MSSCCCPAAPLPISYRARAAIAGERERALGAPGAAVEAVEDAQARMRQLRGVQQPPEERFALVGQPRLHQRVEHERRVTNPAEAVVPVALAADLLGQRCRGRGRDRARGRVDQQLQRQGAADDGLSPLDPRPQALGPVPPHRSGRRQPALDVATAGDHERFLVSSAQREESPSPGYRIELPSDRSRRQLRLASAPRTQRQGIATLRGHWHPSPSADAGRPGTEAEPRREIPAHRNRPSHRLDGANDLPLRAQVGSGQGHGVNDPSDAAARPKRRLQHVRPGR